MEDIPKNEIIMNNEKDNIYYNSYKVIEILEKTNNGELFLVLDKEREYMLYKIEINFKKDKEMISDEIKK